MANQICMIDACFQPLLYVGVTLGLHSLPLFASAAPCVANVQTLVAPRKAVDGAATHHVRALARMALGGDAIRVDVGFRRWREPIGGHQEQPPAQQRFRNVGRHASNGTCFHRGKFGGRHVIGIQRCVPAWCRRVDEHAESGPSVVNNAHSICF